MSLKSLVVCAEDAATQVLRHILETLGLSVDHCATVTEAHASLDHTRYDSVVLDCENEPEAIETLRRVRASSRNATTLVIAIAGKQNNVRQMFALGINFVLYKPISEERAWSSLRAARSLMQRERRKNTRIAVHASAALDYANAEKVPATLIDLSEEGTAVQSEKKLPPDCRVYFEFALPGHTSLVRLPERLSGRISPVGLACASSTCRRLRESSAQLAHDQRSDAKSRPHRRFPGPRKP